MNNYRNFLEQDYAEKLAKSESIEYYNGFIKKDILFYNNDKELMKNIIVLLNIYILHFPKIYNT